MPNLAKLRTSEDIRSRFVAAGIVQPLVALLSDGSMDTRCKALHPDRYHFTCRIMYSIEIFVEFHDCRGWLSVGCEVIS